VAVVLVVDDRVLVRRLGQALPKFEATVVAFNIGRHSGDTQQIALPVLPKLFQLLRRGAWS
jgi:hypothetical protein